MGDVGRTGVAKNDTWCNVAMSPMTWQVADSHGDIARLKVVPTRVIRPRAGDDEAMTVQVEQQIT